MIATVHLLAGAGVSLLVTDPPSILILALFSHFLLDALPHIDPGTFADSRLPKTSAQLITVITDAVAVAAIGLLFYFTHQHWGLMLLGGLAAILPDLLIPLERYSLYEPFTRFHDMFHWQPKLAHRWSWYIIGLITPAVIALLSALIIFSRYR